MPLDEVIILNVDNNQIETPFDDFEELPAEAVSRFFFLHYEPRGVLHILKVSIMLLKLHVWWNFTSQFEALLLHWPLYCVWTLL